MPRKSVWLSIPSEHERRGIEFEGLPLNTYRKLMRALWRRHYDREVTREEMWGLDVAQVLALPGVGIKALIEFLGWRESVRWPEAELGLLEMERGRAGELRQEIRASHISWYERRGESIHPGYWRILRSPLAWCIEDDRELRHLTYEEWAIHIQNSRRRGRPPKPKLPS